MFPMKLEALIYVLVACLTIVVPSAAYFVFADKLKQQGTEARTTAQRYEVLAKDIEDGKINIHLENIPAYMRLQAKSGGTLADMYANFGSAAKHFLLSMVGVAILQFCLLLYVLRKRKNITPRSTPTSEGVG
jgi:hypothetical protein